MWLHYTVTIHNTVTESQCILKHESSHSIAVNVWIIQFLRKISPLELTRKHLLKTSAQSGLTVHAAQRLSFQCSRSEMAGDKSLPVQTKYSQLVRPFRDCDDQMIESVSKFPRTNLASTDILKKKNPFQPHLFLLLYLSKLKASKTSEVNEFNATLNFVFLTIATFNYGFVVYIFIWTAGLFGLQSP